MIECMKSCQVMGDRLGNIRWWDVTTGLSSWFSTHQGGVRRIKFAPVSHADHSRGRIAVLFNEHNFAIYDLVSGLSTCMKYVNRSFLADCQCCHTHEKIFELPSSL